MNYCPHCGDKLQAAFQHFNLSDRMKRLVPNCRVCLRSAPNLQLVRPLVEEQQKSFTKAQATFFMALYLLRKAYSTKAKQERLRLVAQPRIGDEKARWGDKAYVYVKDGEPVPLRTAGAKIKYTTVRLAMKDGSLQVQWGKRKYDTKHIPGHYARRMNPQYMLPGKAAQVYLRNQKTIVEPGTPGEGYIGVVQRLSPKGIELRTPIGKFVVPPMFLRPPDVDAVNHEQYAKDSLFEDEIPAVSFSKTRRGGGYYPDRHMIQISSYSLKDAILLASITAHEGVHAIVKSKKLNPADFLPPGVSVEEIFTECFRTYGTMGFKQEKCIEEVLTSAIEFSVRARIETLLGKPISYEASYIKKSLLQKWLQQGYIQLIYNRFMQKNHRTFLARLFAEVKRKTSRVRQDKDSMLSSKEFDGIVKQVLEGKVDVSFS